MATASGCVFNGLMKGRTQAFTLVQIFMENTLNTPAYSPESTTVTVLNTFYYLAFFLFIIPVLTHFLAVAGALIAGSLSDIALNESWTESVSYFALTSGIAAVFLCATVKYSLNTRQLSLAGERLAFTSLRIKPLVSVLIITALFSSLERLSFEFWEMSAPVFITNVVEQLTSASNIVLLFLTVVIIAPVSEEVIFRGVAFYRLKETRLGVSGAIIIPSMLFSLIHLQYEQSIIFVMLFLSAVMFGVIRHITGNLWYCVISHMLMNLIVFVECVVQG